MSTPQPGIFALGTRNHYHLEFDVAPDADPVAVATAVRGLRDPAVAGGANLVIGFGAALWGRIAPPDEVPADLAGFAPIGVAPATQHDLWVWVHGTGDDAGLDAARAVVARLSSVAVLALEQPCFVYRDSRDLTGFIDGTENPPIEEAAAVALVPHGSPGAGGSHVLAQRWVHDLARFSALAVAEQEAVIGRTKLDSVELDDDVKPPTSHLARVVMTDDDGEEIEIFRRSTPYGTVREAGLYFVAFASDPTRFTRMLARMLGTSGDGLHDRITEFSTPVSGSFYFAPSLEALAALGAG